MGCRCRRSLKDSTERVAKAIQQHRQRLSCLMTGQWFHSRGKCEHAERLSWIVSHLSRGGPESHGGQDDNCRSPACLAPPLTF